MLKHLRTITFVLGLVSAQVDKVPPKGNPDTHQDRQIALLLDQMHALTHENANVVKKLDAFNAEIGSLKTELNELKAENIKLYSSMSILQAGPKSSDIKLHNMSNGDGVHMHSVVSFTAYPTVDREYTFGDIVLFDGIVRNYGEHYDAAKSQFVCPVTAYYLFMVTVRSHPPEGMHATIQLDNEDLAQAAGATGAYNDLHDQGSNSVVTLCEVDQVVTVYVSYGSINKMQGGDWKSSTFTGVLLHLA